jgi:hypothetical protein
VPEISFPVSQSILTKTVAKEADPSPYEVKSPLEKADGALVSAFKEMYLGWFDCWLVSKTA